MTSTTDLTNAGLAALVGMAYTKFQDLHGLAVSQNTYGADYFLGDTVTIQALGSSSDVQLTKVRETITVSGSAPSYDITCAFGKPVPTLTDQVSASLANLAQSGVRVGASIVNAGSNANGTYIQFDDGTMIQYGVITWATVGTTGIEITVTFPTSFINTGYSETAMIGDPSSTADTYIVGKTSNSAARTVSQFGCRPATYSGTVHTVNGTMVWQAIGRWRV
jgi:hypothetical protein